MDRKNFQFIPDSPRPNREDGFPVQTEERREFRSVKSL
jgi:hypothetical protein